jgi:hypothetical protein
MAEYGDDLRGMAEITAVWRQVRSLHRLSDDERMRMLGQLGLGPEQQREARDLLDRFHDLPLVEPGGFIDESGCDLGWQLSVMAPVFYGFTDYGPPDGLPEKLRVFYPSIERSPQDAPILAGCGRYPLVIFLHGSCSEENHYLKWDLVPMELARSGYVVAVPDFSNEPPFSGLDNPDVAKMEQIVHWVRQSWPNAGNLMPAPMTAVVGHSWGALLGASLAVVLQAQGSVSAYAGLSGGWLEWPSLPPRPLSRLDMAAMFMWGTGSSDIFARLEGGADLIWQETPGATHKVVFRGGEHWDYLRQGTTTCADFNGPCTLMRSLAADFLTTFLSHYMPPQKWLLLNATIPHSLIPPPLNLTPEQEFFAGGHLAGFAEIGSSEICSFTHTWRLPPFGGGSITLP